jgi:hypothetical protein
MVQKDKTEAKFIEEIFGLRKRIAQLEDLCSWNKATAFGRSLNKAKMPYLSRTWKPASLSIVICMQKAYRAFKGGDLVFARR